MEKEVKKEQPVKDAKKSDMVIETMEDTKELDTNAAHVKLKVKDGHYHKVRELLKLKKYHTVLVAVKGDYVIAEFEK